MRKSDLGRIGHTNLSYFVMEGPIRSCTPLVLGEDLAPDLANNSYLATIRATLLDERVNARGTRDLEIWKEASTSSPDRVVFDTLKPKLSNMGSSLLTYFTPVTCLSLKSFIDIGPLERH
jgi:hypothetical protein